MADYKNREKRRNHRYSGVPRRGKCDLPPAVFQSLFLALALLLAGCAKNASPTAADTGSSESSSESASTISDANPPKTCIDRGKAAADIATQRDKGSTLDQVLASIDQSDLSDDDKASHKDLARQLYTDPFASKLSPDNAANNFQGSCVADLKSKTSNIRNFTNTSDIERALALFRTYNGQPLMELLTGYGVTVTALQVAPASAMNNGNYKPDDTVFTLTVGSSAHDDIPCHLQQWLKGDITPTPEFVQRGPAFPLIRPNDDDPLIYWAATGKCSTAFNN